MLNILTQSVRALPNPDLGEAAKQRSPQLCEPRLSCQSSPPLFPFIADPSAQSLQVSSWVEAIAFAGFGGGGAWG